MKISKVPLRLEPRLEGGYPVTSPTLHSLRIRGDREARERRARAMVRVAEEATRHG